jgi:hypothetical protein
LFINVYLWLGGHWVCSLLLSHCWSAAPGSRRDSAAWFLALGYLISSLTNAWLLEVRAVLWNVIRIYLLASSTRSISECTGVGVVEIPLFSLALVTNQNIRILCVGILSPVKNWDLWNTNRINPFIVISRSFYHCLRQSCDRVRPRMIDIALINRLFHPCIHFNVSTTLRWLLPILIVFHMHILLNLPQVLLRLWNHRLQLRWRKPRSILNIGKLKNIALTAIGKLAASLQRVVDTVSDWLVGFRVVLLRVVADRVGWRHYVALQLPSIEAG